VETQTIDERLQDGVREVRFERGDAAEGLLRVRSGISDLHLRTAPMEDLFRGRFEGVLPELACEGGVLDLRYRLSPLEWLGLVAFGDTRAELVLRADMPWALEISGGVSRIHADLRGIELRSLVVTGGASHLELDLPRATGVVPVRITGGASRVTLRRPAGVGARLEVRGGATSLQLDRQRLGAVGGRLQLATPGEGCHDVRVSGGASSLALTVADS
jgi:hypothetical protein